MFNRKKKEIARLRKLLHESAENLRAKQSELAYADERERSLEAQCEELRKEHAEDLKTIADMTKERDHALALAADNGKKLEEQLKANGKLKRQIRNADAKIKKQKQLLDEATRATECPADCKNRKNHNACRTCTRYPNAKDKYEVAG